MQAKQSFLEWGLKKSCRRRGRVLPCPEMKTVGYILAAMSCLAWGAEEVSTYAQGLESVSEDGWVLLCHCADWDSSHDEQWLRRQTAIRSSCGNARVLYVPIYQNPTPEQAAELEQQLQGATVDLRELRSVPCAVLLDRDGLVYATISGDDFAENAAGRIREAQSQLRTRSELLRLASSEEGSQRAQTLSRIWRLSITPPANLHQQMLDADPADSAGIAEWSPFDPAALEKRVRAMKWEDAMAELDRVQEVQLSKEERQAVLAIRIGCVRRHLGAAGAREIRQLTDACTALAPGTPLGKAARRAAALWGNRLELTSGWRREQLPLEAAECDIAGAQMLSKTGEFRLGIVPTMGEDPVRVTSVALYDGEKKISEDTRTCCLKAGEKLDDNEYMLIVRQAPVRPRLIITFDQQGRRNCDGCFTLRYFNEDGKAEIKIGEQKKPAEPEKRSEENTPAEYTTALPEAVEKEDTAP